LNEFLLKKSGRTWDDVIEQRAAFADIDEKAVAVYLKMSEKAGRLPEPEALLLPELLEKLRLAENGKLKRTAIVFFGKDPGRFYPGLSVKIGRFGKKDSDLLFQEVEEGNLVVLLDAVLRQLHHKFLVRTVSFEGVHRVETPPYPLSALREMLLNALIHRSYTGAPTVVFGRETAEGEKGEEG
jgi:ATP-dependent DNA helicase RecG